MLLVLVEFSINIVPAVSKIQFVCYRRVRSKTGYASHQIALSGGDAARGFFPDDQQREVAGADRLQRFVQVCNFIGDVLCDVFLFNFIYI